MSLQSRLTALATAIGTDIKSIRDSYSNVAMDTWHAVGSGGVEPAFGVNMGYGNLGGVEGEPSQATVAFRKLPTGIVELRGAVQLSAGGTGFATAFTLPVGYRPPAMLILDTYGSVGAGNPPQQVRIWPDGKVKVPGGVGTYLLDGLSFDTETVTNWTVGQTGPKGDTGAKGDPGNAGFIPIGTWHALNTLGGSYSAGVTVANSSVEFKKFPDGVVRLRGRAYLAATQGQVGILPAGYTPPWPGNQLWRWAVPCEATSGGSVGIGRCYIAPGGNIWVDTPPAGAVYFDLSSISFDTETVTQINLSFS